MHRPRTSDVIWRPAVVVVPCYNEQRRLKIDQFLTYGRSNEDVGFLFVDDGSSDGTARLLAAAAEENPDTIRFKALEENRGKAEAVRTGLRDAIALGARTAGYWDADLATPLEELSGMLRVLEGDEHLWAVLGSRVRLLGRTIVRNPWRHYLGRVFATAASLLLRMPVYDTQCGAKVFRVQDALERALERPFRTRWVFDVELLARLRGVADGELVGRLEEYPLRTWTDVEGSKIRAREFFRLGWDLARISSVSRGRSIGRGSGRGST